MVDELIGLPRFTGLTGGLVEWLTSWARNQGSETHGNFGRLFVIDYLSNMKDGVAGSTRVLVVFNLILPAYFIGLFLLYQAGTGGGLIQFFVELLTIPLLLAQPVLLVIGLLRVRSGNASFWLKASLIVLAISTVLTYGDLLRTALTG